MTPGRKFSTTTSAELIRPRADARSAVLFKLRTIFCLLRCSVALATVFQNGPPGGSTWMISAPWSARSRAVRGPASHWPKSITLMPSRAPAMLHLLFSWVLTAQRLRLLGHWWVLHPSLVQDCPQRARVP